VDAQAPQVTEERLQTAVDACAKAGADLVYLYGSQARARCWTESDVDLAVLLGPRAGKDRYGAIRVGDYRVVYEIDDSAKTIRVMRVRHRSEVYR